MIPTTGYQLSSAVTNGLTDNISGVVNTIFNVGPDMIFRFLPITFAIVIVGLIFFYVKRSLRTR